MGAAVATVIGQNITAILAIWYLLHMKIAEPSKKDFIMPGKVSEKNAEPRHHQLFISDFLGCSYGSNQQYAALLCPPDAIFRQEQFAQISMAVVGIVVKFSRLSFPLLSVWPLAVFQLSVSIWEQEKKPRVKTLFTKLRTSEIIVGAVAFVLVEFFPKGLISI